jgi:hypothetical protein
MHAFVVQALRVVCFVGCVFFCLVLGRRMNALLHRHLFSAVRPAPQLCWPCFMCAPAAIAVVVEHTCTATTCCASWLVFVGMKGPHICVLGICTSGSCTHISVGRHQWFSAGPFPMGQYEIWCDVQELFKGCLVGDNCLSSLLYALPALSKQPQ